MNTPIAALLVMRLSSGEIVHANVTPEYCIDFKERAAFQIPAIDGLQVTEYSCEPRGVLMPAFPAVPKFNQIVGQR